MSSQLVGEVVVVDGSGHRLGRLASKVAKMLLEGRKVVVINADKVLVSGSKKAILERYLKLVGRTWYSSIEEPQVWYPRRADGILWYTVGRMLPMRTRRGREALKRLRVYVGVPQDLEKHPHLKIEDALSKSSINRSGKLIRTLTLGEVAALLKGGAVDK